jgi:hypothetical protein
MKAWNPKMQAGFQPVVMYCRIRQRASQQEHLNDRHSDHHRRNCLPCGPQPWQWFFLLLHYQRLSQTLWTSQEWISS